jgi:hypothetical protein
MLGSFDTFTQGAFSAFSFVRWWKPSAGTVFPYFTEMPPGNLSINAEFTIDVDFAHRM